MLMFDEKLKYWKDELEIQFMRKYDEQCRYLSAQIEQLHNDMSAQHESHISEIAQVREIKTDTVQNSKNLILRLASIEVHNKLMQ